jgi:pyrroloquinoline quinone biosynthesis protein B
MNAILKHFIWLSFLLHCTCAPPRKAPSPQNGISLIVLGVAQDGGYPHAGCRRDCCRRVWSGRQPQSSPACLAIADGRSRKVWMLEATPAYPAQWERLIEETGWTDKNAPDGIFLTHAHIGHYTGLMYLGREALGAKAVPVYALPRMKNFLETNGPWSQLVSLKNIAIQPMLPDSAVALAPGIRVTPFSVPHRDEFSETAGYRIEAGGKRILFIPDIDKWEKWERDISREIRDVDIAYLDATFYKNGELQRDMREIPHPFVEESMRLFDILPATEKAKIHFIHFNHTNPLLWNPAEVRVVEARGFRVAQEGAVVLLSGQ